MQQTKDQKDEKCSHDWIKVITWELCKTMSFDQAEK